MSETKTKEFTVFPFGPQHPVLPEPLQLRFTVDEERIVEVVPTLDTSTGASRGLASSTLVEVIDRILDKGLVLDFWVTVALIGIEIVSVEGRVVIDLTDKSKYLL